MRLQIIQDSYGQNTGIFVPINDWLTLIQKYQGLKALVSIEPTPKLKLSQLAGKLSDQTAEDMLKFVAESRSEWDERLNNQL